MESANSGTFEGLLKRGELIESVSEMTPDYLRELKHTLIVSGDTELISAPAYYLAARKAPSVNAFMTGIAIIQDELAHAHIAYHILEELGESQEALIFKRDPKAFRYPYAFETCRSRAGPSWWWPTRCTIRPDSACSVTSTSNAPTAPGNGGS